MQHWENVNKTLPVMQVYIVPPWVSHWISREYEAICITCRYLNVHVVQVYYSYVKMLIFILTILF